ncbi:MAG: hypothetical protein ACRENP_13475 [Longimicrobiales bacterium]
MAHLKPGRSIEQAVRAVAARATSVGTLRPGANRSADVVPFVINKEGPQGEGEGLLGVAVASAIGLLIGHGMMSSFTRTTAWSDRVCKACVSRRSGCHPDILR